MSQGGILFMLWEECKRTKVRPVKENPKNTSVSKEIPVVCPEPSTTQEKTDSSKYTHPCPHCQT